MVVILKNELLLFISYGVKYLYFALGLHMFLNQVLSNIGLFYGSSL